MSVSVDLFVGSSHRNTGGQDFNRPHQMDHLSLLGTSPSVSVASFLPICWMSLEFRQILTFLCFGPVSNPECRYLASSSKDSSVRIWDTVLGRCEKILTGHTQSVTCLKWGGDGLLYTSSQDRTVKVWRAQDVSAWCLSTPLDDLFQSVALILAFMPDLMLHVGHHVQDTAGPRPLGEHSSTQHRLRPAHWSF